MMELITREPILMEEWQRDDKLGRNIGNEILSTLLSTNIYLYIYIHCGGARNLGWGARLKVKK